MHRFVIAGGAVMVLAIHANISITPAKRAHHALVYDEKHKLIVMTAGSTPVNGGQSFDFFNDLWCFNGKTWKQSGQAGNQRSGVQLAYDSKRDRILSFGGYAGDSSLSDLRVLEGNEWKTLSWHPGMKAAEPGFVYDAKRDRFIAFGGSAGRGQANGETWEWDGVGWTKFNGPSPEARQAFAMIYDSRRHKTVLFGGGSATGQSFGDTWEFDGSGWTKMSAEGPGPLVSPGFCYDAKKGLLIIFGGMGKDGFSPHTWSWDGKEWKQLASTGPSARVMGYMAYDKERDKTVLFGGRPGWPNDVNDTWEWDGTQWTEVKTN